MAAFTEGFTDTSKPGKDHIGSMIAKVIAARQLAREERELAEEKAQKAGYDNLEELGIGHGFFMKAALKDTFGGSYIGGKKQDLKQAIDRVKLLKDPKAQFWNFVDNRDADGKKVKKLSDIERFREQFDNYNFVSAKRPPENVEPESEMVPDTAEETAAAVSGSKARVSREDLLSAITEIGKSLQATADSINKSVGDQAGLASSVAAMNTNIVEQISHRTDGIEKKLDDIVAAINGQTNLVKSEVDKKQGDDSIDDQQVQMGSGASETDPYDDLATAVDESKEQSASEAQDEVLDEVTKAADGGDDDNEDDTPTAETGGIFSGPDTGYLVELHGDEVVQPLDNKATDGIQGNEVTGGKDLGRTPRYEMGTAAAPRTGIVNMSKGLDVARQETARTPMFPKYEIGTPPRYEMGTESALGGKIGFDSLPKSETPNVDDGMVQPLMDAMSLPMMVSGGTVLSATTQLLGAMGPQGGPIADAISSMIRPITDIFGLPNTLAKKATDKSVASGDKKGPLVTARGEKEEKKKNIFQKIGSFISGIFGGDDGGDQPPGPSGPPGASILTGNKKSMAQQIYNYLMSKPGMTHNKAMGIVANINSESGFDQAVESGDDGGAGGLFQFKGSRGKAMQAATGGGDNWKGDWKGQVDFALQDETGPEYMQKEFSSPDEAAAWWMNYFEKPREDLRPGRHTDHADFIRDNADMLRKGGANLPPEPSDPKAPWYVPVGNMKVDLRKLHPPIPIESPSSNEAEKISALVPDTTPSTTQPIVMPFPTGASTVPTAFNEPTATTETGAVIASSNLASTGIFNVFPSGNLWGN